MPKEKTNWDRFTDLSWSDLCDWAGGKVVSRGSSYQAQRRVSDLATTDDGALIAWVSGSERYAVRVAVDADGVPESICTCPYGIGCKHAVAVVLEYSERVKNDQPIPKASKDDKRLALLEAETSIDNEAGGDDGRPRAGAQSEIGAFLEGKTKAQLTALVIELAERHPAVARDLADRERIGSGNIEEFVSSLRQDIHELGERPGWRNPWEDESYTPDYSGIRARLEALLEAGRADAVLDLGPELIADGIELVEQSDDEGATFAEVESCMPAIVKALEQSSLSDAEKLAWAADIVLDDNCGICERIADYLNLEHSPSAWSALADRLLGGMKSLKVAEGHDNFSRNYARDRLSNLAIHALERAGRADEIIPLCQAEARITCSYDRLVGRLIEARRYDEAEQWIHEGIRATGEKWPGIASGLRDKLREIRTLQGNPNAVAAIRAEEFVRQPSLANFKDCREAAEGIGAWPEVRRRLLAYLESGEMPWRQEGWPLPESGLERPKANPRTNFPRIEELIDIAILEKQPERVLHWYDMLLKKGSARIGFDDDAVAAAVQDHAPDRAVSIWKAKAERLIAQVKPRSYEEAVVFFRKAAEVMIRENRQAEWESYLNRLRTEHRRKRRLIEILERLDGGPLLKMQR